MRTVFGNFTLDHSAQTITSKHGPVATLSPAAWEALRDSMSAINYAANVMVISQHAQENALVQLVWLNYSAYEG